MVCYRKFYRQIINYVHQNTSTLRHRTSYLNSTLTNCAGGRHNMPPPMQVDLWPFDLESGVRITCDVGYLCANFSLPRPLCSRLRPDVRDRLIRQTSYAHHRLMPLYPRGGGIMSVENLVHCQGGLLLIIHISYQNEHKNANSLIYHVTENFWNIILRLCLVFNV